MPNPSPRLLWALALAACSSQRPTPETEPEASVFERAAVTTTSGSSTPYRTTLTAYDGLGDTNGDGFDDLVLGYPALSGGQAHVWDGSDDGSLGAYDHMVTTTSVANPNRFAEAAGRAGDVNGDGLADLVVGEWTTGTTWLYYGHEDGIGAGGSATLVDIYGAGRRVTGLGDVDGDGFDDVLTGNVAYGDYGDLVYGGAGGLDVANPVRMDGLPALIRLGDIDGDGFDDAALAKPSVGGGEVWIYPGSASGLVTTPVVLSRAEATGFGALLAGDLDLNADGFSDLVVYESGTGPDDWRTNVYLGAEEGFGAPATTFRRKLDDEAGVTQLVSAGDVNGDGYDDLVVVVVDGDGLDHAYVLGGNADGLSSPVGGHTTFAHNSTVFFPIGDFDGDGNDDLGRARFLLATGAAEVVLGCVDADDDGYCPDTDCDDNNADVGPGQQEIAGDGIDQDCNGDEICFVDDDEDGFPSGLTVSGNGLSCAEAGEAYGGITFDCDDQDAGISPDDAEIIGDGLDQDCDDSDLCYIDADVDGYGAGTQNAVGLICGEGLANTSLGADCDDGNAAVHPGVQEGADDGVDQDCDGFEHCWVDGDKDGHADPSPVPSTSIGCDGFASGLVGYEDCDDDAATTHPGATELGGDEVDQDCDGLEACFADADGDGVRTDVAVVGDDLTCGGAGEALATVPGGDCADDDASRHAGAVEVVANGVDEDCDGAELCYADADADGVRTDAAVAGADGDCDDDGEALATVLGGDCDDDDASRHAGAVEAPGNNVDEDCDGFEMCFAEADGDGYRTDVATLNSDADCDDAGEALVAATGGDCDDSDALVKPGVDEIPADGRDQDCDGLETCLSDADEDGYRTDAFVESEDPDCSDFGEALSIAARGDCDDLDPEVSPEGVEIAGDGIDQDCSGADLSAEDPKSCGCSTSGTPAGAWIFGLLALGLRRRR